MIFKKTLLTSAVAMLFASQATAKDVSLINAPVLTGAEVSASLTTEQLVAQQQATFAKQRAAFAEYFADAYAAYPALPEGMLETLAYVGSRWEHRIPKATAENHHHMPMSYGLFGLYDDNKAFTNTLTLVADFAGVSKKEMLADARTYVMATAAYLENQLVQEGLEGASLEQAKPVLMHISGLKQGNSIQNYAVNSFLYDVYQSLEKGADDHGINITPRTVAWGDVFTAAEMNTLRSPELVIDFDNEEITAKGESFVGSAEVNRVKQTSTETPGHSINSTDYGPALWQTSPNYSSRNSGISHVAIHTTQGSYAGAISWLCDTRSSASAHYVIRSSDGQVTQIVRDSKKAWHAKSANPYSIGIEHEGYVSSSSWYTTAMYNSSANLTKHMCSQHNISCSSAYSGSAHSSVVQLSQSYTVKGHQHFPSQSHTDPGIYWNWGSYYSKINGTSGGGSGGGSSIVLDSFESGEGHFTTYPTYSGSTVGISSSSTADRVSSPRYNGSYSQRLKFVDNSSTSSSWAVRHLSGSGSTSKNTKFSRNGKVGFWVYSGGSGMQAAIGIDDSDGTERSDKKTIPTNTWTYMEWDLTRSSDWNAWYNGNGAISASQVSIDAIWFFRANTSYTVYVYIDDVQFKAN